MLSQSVERDEPQINLLGCGRATHNMDTSIKNVVSFYNDESMAVKHRAKLCEAEK